MKIKEKDVDRGVDEIGQCRRQGGSREADVFLFGTRGKKLELGWLRFLSGNPMRTAPCAFSHHKGHDDCHFTH